MSVKAKDGTVLATEEDVLKGWKEYLIGGFLADKEAPKICVEVGNISAVECGDQECKELHADQLLPRC